MKAFLLNHFLTFDGGDWITGWLILLGVAALAVGAFFIAYKAATQKKVTPQDRKIAIGTLIVGTGLTGLLVWLIGSLGAQMVVLTGETFGPWIKNLLVGVGICLALALVVCPVNIIGSQLRLSCELRRKNIRGGKARRPLIIGAMGTLILICIGVGLHIKTNNWSYVGYYVLPVGVAMGFGWFGIRLIPIPEELEAFLRED